jgi:probable HAF family extracellular repeat protein
MHRRLASVPAILLAGLCGSVPATAAQPAPTAYTVTDLGTNGDYVNRATVGAIVNHTGEVLVYSPEPLPARQFVWSAGEVTELSPLDAAGFNDAQQVVGGGASGSTGDGEWHALLWQRGVLVDLGTLSGGTDSAALGGFASAARAINATGHVVGGSVTGPLQRFGRAGTHAFLWTDGTMTDLGTLPGGSFSVAVGINVADQIAGDADVPGGEPHAVMWDHGSLIDLGMLPGYVRSHAWRISDAGQIAGWVERTGLDGIPHARAFVYSDGTLRELSTLADLPESTALGVNTAGQIVGAAGTVYGQNDVHDRAVLWNAGLITDLNTLIPADTGWELQWAEDINNAGQIVGAGTIHGQRHAFLLTPAAW